MYSDFLKDSIVWYRNFQTDYALGLFIVFIIIIIMC